MFSEPRLWPYMYILETEWYLNLYMAYIFLNARIMFLRNNLSVLNSNVSVNILFLVSFTFKEAKQKMIAKTTSVPYFCYILLHD